MNQITRSPVRWALALALIGLGLLLSVNPFDLPVAV
jgi:hypothetical protein